MMKIYESILDDIEAKDRPAATQVATASNELPNPYDDTDEFDLLLSIPVTSVDGQNYDKLMTVKEKVYDFFDIHPSIIAYSRILIGSWFHFFENDPDIRHDISNREQKFDTIFLVAIKMNFRTFMDIASFVTGLNSIVRSREARNAGIQFIKRDPETKHFYFDFSTWDEFILDKGVECCYFTTDAALKAKNRRLNGREFLDLVELCLLLTKGHFTMNMFRKIYAGTSFSIKERIFNDVIGNTLRQVRFRKLTDFLKDNAFDAYSLGNDRDTLNSDVTSYFRLVPINKIDAAPSSGRFSFGYSRELFTDKSNQMRNFLQKLYDGRPIETYTMNRIVIRGTYRTNDAPVKLALWLGIDEIPGYDVPCVVLFMMGITKPNNPDDCAEFIYRFKHIFKNKPSEELCLTLQNNLLNDE